MIKCKKNLKTFNITHKSLLRQTDKQRQKKKKSGNLILYEKALKKIKLFAILFKFKEFKIEIKEPKKNYSSKTASSKQ